MYTIMLGLITVFIIVSFIILVKNKRLVIAILIGAYVIGLILEIFI